MGVAVVNGAAVVIAGTGPVAFSIKIKVKYIARFAPCRGQLEQAHSHALCLQ